MPSLQDIIWAGHSGLAAQQQVMSNISQNLANINTNGYHRRVTILAANPEQNPTIDVTSKLPTNGGVRVLDVVRVYNAVQESMLRSEQSNEEYHTQKSAALTDLQSLLSGSNDNSLVTRLQGFWDNWQAVSNNPTDLGARSALLEQGASLATNFQHLSQTLNDYRNGLAALDGAGTPTGVIPDVVEKINSLARQIQTINYKITLAGPAAKTFEMLDARELLLSDLSKCVDISVAADGTVTMDGQTFISSDGLTRNTLAVTDTTGAITFSLGGTAVTPRSGDLAAWTEAAASVDAARSNLDLLADTLMTGVNTLHTSGFDLNGNSAADFFTGTDTDGDGIINANTLVLNTLLYDPANPNNNNPRGIAAAATRAGVGVPNAADGNMARQIANLANATFAALNDESFSTQFNSQLIRIGAAINNEKQDATNAANVAQMLSNAIQQESGVNTDEEMVNMITSQRAYQAAAKIVSVSNEMMDAIINMI